MVVIDKETYYKIKEDKPNEEFLNECKEVSKLFKKNEAETFDEMIKAGQELKEALGISDGEVYDLKRDNKEERYCTVAESLEQSLKEMQLIKEGKIPKKTWKECRGLWDKWNNEVEESEFNE